MFVVIIGAALAVVSQRNVVHCAVALMVCFLGVAGYYALLQAEFLAGVQVLIYVGAITVLMIFAIMLTQQLSGNRVRYTNRQSGLAAVAALVVFALLLDALTVFHSIRVSFAGPADLTRAGTMPSLGNNLPVATTTTELIGQHFIADYIWPFEVASLILLVALIGAIYIARDTKTEVGER